MNRSYLVLFLAFISITPLFEAGAKVIILFLYIVSLTAFFKLKTSLPRLIVLLILFIYILLLELFTAEIHQLELSPFLVLVIISIIAAYLTHEAIGLDFRNTFISFEKYFFVFALTSLIVYFLVLAFPSISTYSLSYTYGGFSSRTLLILNFYTTESGILPRNVGVASEPALWQLIVLFSMILHFRYSQRINLLRVLIYSVVVFSTGSSLGIFALLIVSLFLLSFKQILAILSASVIFFTFIMDSNSFIFVSKVSENYMIERYTPTYNSLSASMLNPFGYGSSYYDENVMKEDIGGHDSLSQILYRYGLVGLILFLVLISLSFRNSIEIALLILLTSLSQTVWFLPFVLLILFQVIRQRI